MQQKLIKKKRDYLISWIVNFSIQGFGSFDPNPDLKFLTWNDPKTQSLVSDQELGSSPGVSQPTQITTQFSYQNQNTPIPNTLLRLLKPNHLYRIKNFGSAPPVHTHVLLKGPQAGGAADEGRVK